MGDAMSGIGYKCGETCDEVGSSFRDLNEKEKSTPRPILFPSFWMLVTESLHLYFAFWGIFPSF